MALALYRKYRPRTFAEVIGQDHVTEPLSQALRSGRLHHAYLFSGPRGCGKTSSARILARSLNCEQGPTPEPCGVCESCRALANDGGGSIDVIEIDAASHGGVDDARELRERAFFAPASSRYKIYVIDEAHMVSSAGFNALLKLVEEPPDYVKFIFATTEPEKVLGTIKSRTHHYPFRLIPPGVLRPYLEQLCEAEGVNVDPAVYPLVVRAGGGSARDSLSVLDQLIAGAGPEGVTYPRAVALLGVTDSALLDEMCDALAAGDGAAAYATVDRVADAGHDPRRFAADLLERLRDLIVLQQVPEAATKGLIDGPADQVERMAAQAQRLGPATLSRCADIVHNGLVEMRGTTAPRLLLELICARMLLPGADDSTGGLLQRLERMERRLSLSAPDGSAAAPAAPPPARAAPIDPPAPPAAGTAPVDPPAPVRPTGGPPTGEAAPAGVPPNGSAPGSASAARAGTAAPAESAARTESAVGPSGGPTGSGPGPAVAARRPVSPAAVMPDPVTPDPVVDQAPGELDAAAVRRVWGEIVAMVNRSNKRIAALVRDATVRDLTGDTLTLTFRYPVHAQMVAGQAEVLVDALYEELGGRWQVRCEVAGEQREAAGRPPAAPNGGGPAGRPVPQAGSDPGRDRSVGGRTAGPPGAPAGGSTPAGSAAVSPTESAGSSGSASAPTEDDWPTPARPGGSSSGGASPTASADAGAADDWPTPVRPGGSGTSSGSVAGSPGTTPGSVAGAPAAVRRAAAPSGAASAGTVTMPRTTDPLRTGNAEPTVKRPVSGGLAAARAAAAARGSRAGGTTPARATPASGAAVADQEWAGEPPYDPEYDGPASPAAGYEGFDPGDEPLDEVVDERTARQTSEQQAVQLLEQAFRAERIGEVDAR
ncbi:DNA polymerase III subunit gamma and tau [Plantactinospora sp. GCM10030261]|uniref:DNA polymerase III subunit gamma and tau n=1 Tax=Plantactinospora sp. GCM10030261 TaxID=3273420 RepID=UPI00360CC27A